MMLPFQTALERPWRTPRKARSEVVFGAACSWVVSKSMCWRAWVAYAPVTRASAPGPTQPRLHPHVAASRSEPERDPIEAAVATDLGALGAEDPAALGQRLAAHISQVRVIADDQLGDDVEHPVEILGAGEELLPDLRLGPLFQDDQRALVDQGSRPRLNGGERDRILEHHAAGHVHERAAAGTGIVDGDERIVSGDDGADVAIEQLTVVARPPFRSW